MSHFNGNHSTYICVTNETFILFLILEPQAEQLCYCAQPKYGAMAQCSVEECTKVHFHLTCIGLSTVPTNWLCDDGKGKKQETIENNEMSPFLLVSLIK